MDERTLVDAACKGSAACFNELVGRHQDVAYSVAWLLLGCAAEAGQATEDALHAAYRALPLMRGGSFEGWLLRFVVRACRERGRSPSRPARRARKVSLPAPGQEALRAAEVAIGALPWEQRVALVLADVQGLSCEEVARVTGDSLDRVKRRLRQGRGRLGRELATDYGNGLGRP